MKPMGFSEYRQYLLQAVEIVLEGTEEAQNRAGDLIQDLPRPQAFSINSLVWHGIISELSDSMLRREADELWQKEWLLLSGTSPHLQREYIHFDFRRYMSDEDRQCLRALQTLGELLGQFPFASPDEALQEHAQKEQAALAAVAAIPLAEDIGDELVYRWILREVGAILAPIALEASLRFHYLMPLPPYGEISMGLGVEKFPDVGDIVLWTKRALAALTNTDWLMVTWQLRGDMLILSLL